MLVQHYFDYKSPYAYLAQQDTFALLDLPGVELTLIPYTLDIPSYLGQAKVDERGHVLEESRNAHQWRRVRYAYMDCRREANRRGLTVRGPRKIFDSRLSHIAFLYATEHGVGGEWRTFHANVYQKFWRRELDIEDVDVMSAELADAGIAARDFREFAAGPGLEQLASLQAEAEDAGVFGVPSYRVDGELYWGTEKLPRVIEHVSR